MTNRELIEQVAERWNAGDTERWLELYSEDVEFLSSPSWPETQTVRGHDGLRQFERQFRDTWDAVELRADEIHEADDAAVIAGAWITRGRASGLEGTLDIKIAFWFAGGKIVRGQFFEELSDALEAVGLAD